MKRKARNRNPITAQESYEKVKFKRPLISIDGYRNIEKESFFDQPRGHTKFADIVDFKPYRQKYYIRGTGKSDTLKDINKGIFNEEERFVEGPLFEIEK